MVVRKTMVDVARRVICTWRVVCGERGRGIESCWGWRVGDAGVAAAAMRSDGGCAGDGAFGDVGMMRGISASGRCQMSYINDFDLVEGFALIHRGMSSTAFSPSLGTRNVLHF